MLVVRTNEYVNIVIGGRQERTKKTIGNFDRLFFFNDPISASVVAYELLL